MIHPCRGVNESARPADVAVMRSDFVGFEPRIQKMLAMVDSSLLWSLLDRKPLNSWIHPEGKICLLGDACHPMLGAGICNGGRGRSRAWKSPLPHFQPKTTHTAPTGIRDHPTRARNNDAVGFKKESTHIPSPGWARARG